MKILLFGKTGQLGWELQRTLAPLGEVLAYGPDDIDLANLKSVETVIKEAAPQLIVNAAAYTAVDRAEEEAELAARINLHAPGVMAETARSIHAALIHYSTDYVFDGKKRSAYREDDLTNPLNVYGKTKLDGERAIRQVGGAHVILRTSWVYSLGSGGFVSKVLSWARKQETMRVVTDQVGSPTWARMLAEISSAMIARSLPDPVQFFEEKAGLYHLGGAGAVSRFDFTREIIRLDPQAGEQIVQRVEPALTADFPTPAQRPLFTALDCSRFEETFGLCMPQWEKALELAMHP